MTEKEKNKKIEELKKQWEEEIKSIPDENNQPSDGMRLDNGDGGKYTEITEKYRKIINDLINEKN